MRYLNIIPFLLVLLKENIYKFFMACLTLDRFSRGKVSVEYNNIIFELFIFICWFQIFTFFNVHHLQFMLR